jgi:surface polysaccharide O-acyltransferase-like enzyme
LGQITWNEALFSLIKIPFEPVEGVYWFMYTILGLYLFSPFISKAVENTEYIRFFLILWGITLLLPYINAIIPGAWNIGGDYYRLLSNFGGYLGYMILGNYLYKQNYSWEQTCTICCTCLVVAISIPLCFINNRFDGISNEMLYGYLTINVAALCIIYFLLIKKITTSHCSPSYEGLIRELSAKSFGIYLVHILIMRQGIWPLWQTYFPETSYAIQIPLTALLTFALSYFLIKLLSYLPYSKYIS